MSIRVMSEVWEKSRFRGTNLLCLLALADWSNDGGWSWHGVDGISEKIRIERRQTINVFHTLSTAMELIVHSNAGPSGVNLYWVAVGVQSFTPPPQILGLTVVEPPTYRGSTLVRGAILHRGIAPESLLNVIDDGGDKKEGGATAPIMDSVHKSAPVQENAPPIADPEINKKMLEGFLRASRVSKKRRRAILGAGVSLTYVQKWFVYAEIRGFDVGLAIVNVLDGLPEPEFCDFCAGPDGNHKTIGIDSWREECPRSNNGKLTTKECEEATGVERSVNLAGVE